MSERAQRGVLAGFVLLLLAWLSPVFLSEFEPTGGDCTIHLSESSDLLRSLGQRDLNLWSPSANMGFASGYYYPVLPQLVPSSLALLTGGALSLLTAFKIALVLPLILLPVSCWFGLRAMGMSSGEALGGAVALSCVCSVNRWALGVEGLFGSGLYPQAWAMLFYPLALGWAARYLTRGDGLARAVFYATLTGLCHPFLGFALALPLSCLGWWRGGVRAGISRALLLLGLVLAASAFLWLPILIHYDGFGGFPFRKDEELGLSPRELVLWLVGGLLLDAGRPPVLSLFALTGLLLHLRRARDGGPGVWFALQATLLFFLVGGGLVLGQVHDNLLPFVRFIALLQFALAVLAGATFVRLATATPNRVVRLLLAGCVLLLLIGSHRQMGQRIRTVDHKPGMYRAELQQVIEFLRTAAPGRVISPKRQHAWCTTVAAHTPLPAAIAYGGAGLQSSPNYRYLYTSHPRMSDRAALFNIRYLVTPRSRAQQFPGQEVFSTEHIVVLEWPARGYFDAVALSGTLPRERTLRVAAIERWLERKDPAHPVLGPRAPISRQAAGRVVEESVGPSEYRATVEATSSDPTAFLLRVTHHPGWRATIDDKPATILRVAPDFMALEVPPGYHKIRFTFHRPTWTWLLLIFSLSVLYGLSVLARQRARSDATDA